ncbi:hypothetical protein [Rhodopirellula baltica]|uniref:Uncharacterized protein n=1 Tax=Rhodopirellula baltica SWK14 TaxID=993516 RepID=L7CF51_RHOBT|nr:hypothetical protein [Rhodopirellula baltica]ELP32879.1 hypothetical protein RBSWK_03188 [Rhodopirellula baltica SWK14]
MADDVTIEQRLAAIENQNNTIKSLLLVLAAKTGFGEDEMRSATRESRDIAIALDPSPGEVDPEN